jgi:MarR family transcriptional repressor of emrRAB
MNRLQDSMRILDTGIARVAESLPGVPREEVTLTRLLLMVGGKLLEELERDLKPHGLNDSDFRTLMMLFSSPQGCATPSELCAYAQQSPTNMTRIANALVKHGMVTRAHGVEDRRRILLSITPAGRRFVRKFLPPLFPRVSDAFAGFSDSDKRTMDRLLRRLVLNIDSMTATSESS